LKRWTIIPIRPKISSLAFHVFSRSLHPELFKVYRSQVVEQKHFQAKLEITGEGHVITFNANSCTISEVVCSVNQLLPQKRRLLTESLKDRNVETLSLPRGIEYRTEYALEHAGPDLFAMVRNSLEKKDREYALLQSFDSSGRIATGAMSYIHIETRQRSMTMQALHTFPDDQAVVKVTSTFTVSKATE
jgi:phosphoenolpyruvate carboxylase